MHRHDGIHPTAVIETGARLGSGVQIGAYSVVGKGVIDCLYVGI